MSEEEIRTLYDNLGEEVGVVRYEKDKPVEVKIFNGYEEHILRADGGFPWKPIDTAPRHRVPILVFSRFSRPLRHVPESGWYLSGDGLQVVEWLEGRKKCSKNEGFYTQWKELPEGPDELY